MPRTFDNRLYRLILATVMIVAVLLTAGFILQSRFDASVRTQYPAPGVMVDLGGHAIHVNCTGSQGPVIVLEAGLTGWSLDWSHVQPELSKHATVCSYDRAGYGWSDPNPSPNTLEQNVRDLRSALLKVGKKPKWILVGHSLGGLHMQAFSRQHPDEVHAVILVDSLEVTMFDTLSAAEFGDYQQNLERLGFVGKWLSKIGAARLLGQPITLISNRHATEQTRITAAAIGHRSSAFETAYNEARQVPSWLEAVEAMPANPDVPTIVMSTLARSDFPPGFEQPHMKSAWATGQQRLAANANTSHMLFPRAGHFLQIEEADALTKAVLSVVEGSEADDAAHD